MFSVTYEIVTPESAEHGEAESRGYILESGGLREALAALLETRTAHCDGIMTIEPSCSDIGQARWIAVCNGTEYLTGAHENRALHIPNGVTPASRERLFRLINA